MRKFSSLTILIPVAIALLLLWTLFSPTGWLQPFQKSKSNTAEQIHTIEHVQQLLSQSRPEEALRIISQYFPNLDDKTSEGQKLLSLYAQSATDSRDTLKLMTLFQTNPSLFVENEKASLLAANGFLILGKSTDYKNVRNLWNHRGINQPKWFLLDADNLVVQGRSQDAIELLKSRSFEGKADIDRLIRLAVLNMNDKPKLSWEYLAEAHKRDPQNKDIRSYRARLLEAVGKSDLAHAEYQSLLDTAPHDFYLRDQLADFYHRQKQYPQALASWSKSLPSKASDRIWLKTIFWNRVITPVDFDWSVSTPPVGKLQPLVNYLLNLHPGEFWDQLQIDHNPHLAAFLKSEQTTFWLRLIQNLVDDNEDEALHLLQNNPFASNSWEPELEDALTKILLFRKSGEASRRDDDHNRVVIGQVKSEHPFFLALSSLNKHNPEQLPQDFQDLLLSQDAFSAAFIAAGWFEAGIHLHKMNPIPSKFPSWVVINYTEALRSNRSDQEALAFAKMQNNTPLLSLLMAEMLIETGKQDEGYTELQTLAKENNETGEKAAWLIALINMDEGKYEEAKMALHSQPSLLNDVKGQELIARIALMQNDLPLATTIYTNLVDKSIEAKSYLAKKAFSEKDWNKARQFTEDLLKEFPNNELLKQNLSKINQEVAAQMAQGSK